MKKIIFSLSLILVGTFMYGQDSLFPYNSGGFGHFFTGPAFLYPGDLNNYLSKPDVLNTKIPVRPGNMTGGEGACVLGRFIIGGGGLGETMGRITTDSVRARLSFGAGYFKFGYICAYEKKTFCYLYGGIGWSGLSLHVENLSDESEIRFNHRIPLAPGHKADYDLACTFYDLGVSCKHLFVSSFDEDAEGGFMLGLDLGCSLSIPLNDWQGANEQVVSGPPVAAGMVNPYLRLTIGGGGFGRRSR